jgi:hypothetical protein
MGKEFRNRFQFSLSVLFSHLVFSAIPRTGTARPAILLISSAAGAIGFLVITLNILVSFVQMDPDHPDRPAH